MRCRVVLSVAAMTALSNVEAFVTPSAAAFGMTRTATKTSLEAVIAPSGEGPENMFQPILDAVSGVFAEKPQEKDAVVIDPDYSLSWLFISAAGMIYLLYPDKSICNPYDIPAHICSPSLLPGILAFLHLWFGIFLADRSARIRCVFHPDRFEMLDVHVDKLGKKKDEMTLREKNYVVGGSNSWNYDSFVNVDFFPSVGLPILCYFKETQTPKGKWVVGPGKYDHRRNGMVHFFPAFCNARQLKREWEARGCVKD